MPLAILMQLIHCAVIASGVSTTWVIAFPEEQAETAARVERLKKQLKSGTK